MNIDTAIEIHRAALLRLLAGMFAVVGIDEGGSVEFVKRYRRLMVLRILGAAESAARRLIFLKARYLPEAIYTPRTDRKKKTSRGKGGASSSAFPLFDKRKRQRKQGRKHLTGPGPRILFFDGSDRVYPASPQTPPPTDDDPVDAQNLCRRLNSLARALGDLEKQAKRLKRAEARRKQRGRLGMQGVLRINTPPGHRQKGRSDAEREVDLVLMECQTLARRWVAAPDTS